MSAPFIWIIIPGITGMILFFLRKYNIGVYIIGLFLSVNLTLAAWVIPIDDIISVGSISYSLKPLLSFSGVQFSITNAGRINLILINAFTVLLMGGCIAARTQRIFIPLCLLVNALIIAAISFNPRIYGVIFFIPATMLYSYILSPPGHKVSNGVTRLLTFQIIGIASILFAGGMILTNSEINETLPEIISIVLLLGIGFIFLFAIFPVYSWIIEVTENLHPYVSVFVFSMMFGGYTLYFSTVIENYHWLFEETDFLTFIRFCGTLMVVTGGAWAAFDRNLGRILGYAVVIEIGYTLLSIDAQYSFLHYMMFGYRMISLSLWSLGLSVLRMHSKDLDFDTIKGIGRETPFASVATLCANFSLAGLPLLAGFPLLLGLWDQLAITSPAMAGLSFLGSVGLLIGGLRSLAVLMSGQQRMIFNSKEELPQRLFLFLGILCLFILGIFPHWFDQLFTSLFITK